AGTALVDHNNTFALARYSPADRLGDPNQRYEAQLYLDLLQRPVDDAGLAVWTSLMSRGFTRLQVAQGIINSTEHHVVQVQSLYNLILNRATDPTGLATWVNFLDRGGSVEQLEALLIGSSEYAARNGGTDNNAFLQGLYRDVLHRPLDPFGAQSW